MQTGACNAAQTGTWGVGLDSSEPKDGVGQAPDTADSWLCRLFRTLWLTELHAGPLLMPYWVNTHKSSDASRHDRVQAWVVPEGRSPPIPIRVCLPARRPPVRPSVSVWLSQTDGPLPQACCTQGYARLCSTAIAEPVLKPKLVDND